jgi:alpha-glucosidase
MTVNGTYTYSCATNSTTMTMVEKRGVGAGSEEGVDLNNPPYAIHNGKIRSFYTNVAIRL